MSILFRYCFHYFIWEFLSFRFDSCSKLSSWRLIRECYVLFCKPIDKLLLSPLASGVIFHIFWMVRCIINHDNWLSWHILTCWLSKITFITFLIHGIMILFFKWNTFGYFRVTFTPVYFIFLLSVLSESNLRRFFSSECYFDFDSLLPFFPLPSALNIHKVPLTGPLSVIASLIISLLALPVISLVQPTAKPLRCKDLRFFSLNASRSTHSFFVPDVSSV